MNDSNINIMDEVEYNIRKCHEIADDTENDACDRLMALDLIGKNVTILLNVNMMADRMEKERGIMSVIRSVQDED